MNFIRTAAAECHGHKKNPGECKLTEIKFNGPNSERECEKRHLKCVCVHSNSTKFQIKIVQNCSLNTHKNTPFGDLPMQLNRLRPSKWRIYMNDVRNMRIVTVLTSDLFMAHLDMPLRSPISI